MPVPKLTKANNHSLLSVMLIALTLLFFRFYFHHNNPLSFDVFGYYLYLPFTFIYHDLGLENLPVLQHIFDTYQPSVSLYQMRPGPEGSSIMLYTMGMAILYAPFFFLSHLVALMTAWPADGFSLPYQWGLIVGSTVYTLAGIWVLRKILLKFFSDKVSALTLLLLFFGTNYFDQSVFNAELAHNHLFTLYTLVLWFTIRWHEKQELKFLVPLAFTTGILILARPTEIVALFIPLLWGVYDKNSLNTKLRMLWQNRWQMLLFAVVVVMVGLPQFIYWKIYSGSFFYDSYTNPGQGLDFLAPHTLQSLFSFRKGWFVYTPVMIFAVWGFYFVYREKRNIFFSLFIFFLLNLYLISSWSCWWYANCFSQRALVQSYAVMAIPLGFFINRLTKSGKLIRWLFTSVALALVVMNLFQTWQIRHGVLSGDRMTFAYYKRIFGKTTVTPEDQRLLLVNRWLEGDERLRDESGYQSRVPVTFDFEKPEKKYRKYYRTDNFHTGRNAFRFDSTLAFFNLFETDFESLTPYDHAWLRVEFYVFPENGADTSDFVLVVDFSHKNKSYKYRTLNLGALIKNQSLQAGRWNKVSFDYLTPEVRSEKDLLKIYFWNKGKSTLLVDDVTVSVFEREDARTGTHIAR